MSEVTEKNREGLFIGRWISVADEMPDDSITVLVWSEHIEDATIAAHDSQVLEDRKDTGWVMPDGHLLLGVTHWCRDIFPPL